VQSRGLYGIADNGRSLKHDQLRSITPPSRPDRVFSVPLLERRSISGIWRGKRSAAATAIIDRIVKGYACHRCLPRKIRQKMYSKGATSVRPLPKGEPFARTILDDPDADSSGGFVRRVPRRHFSSRPFALRPLARRGGSEAGASKRD